MKKFKLSMGICMPIILAGCWTTPTYKDPYANDPYGKKSYPRTNNTSYQSNYSKQKNKTTTKVYNKYPVMSPASYPQPRPGEYELERRANEARQQAQAQLNSNARAQQEQIQRQALAAQEARDIEQTTRNSMQSYAEEERRRQEAAQLEQARQESMKTLAEEEARQLEQAKQESMKTYAEEQARRQQVVVDPQPVLPQNQPMVQSAPPSVPVQEPAQKWKPTENDLVQAGNKLMELKKQKGGQYPSQQEMSSHLQSDMGLSAEQAEKIIKKLGV